MSSDPIKNYLSFKKDFIKNLSLCQKLLYKIKCPIIIPPPVNKSENFWLSRKKVGGRVEGRMNFFEGAKVGPVSDRIQNFRVTHV